MTTTPAPTELATIATEVAEVAAAYIRRRRPELFNRGAADAAAAVSTKSTRTDPVTIGDTEAESLIRRELGARRPADDILGEEEGGDQAAPRGLRWVVDPIDGTVNFLYGLPAYGVSIGAQVDGVSVAGAVADVARGIVYVGAQGGGAWALEAGSRTELRTTAANELELSLIATGFGYGAHRRGRQGEIVAGLLPRVRDIRRVGAASLDLCMVAAGQVDAHYEHGLSPWDWAAGAIIAAEAGAVVHTPPAHSRSATGEVTIAVAPGVAEEFLATLRTLGALAPIADSPAA